MNNKPTSEKLTFRELISKHKIEIPIIQRDYAQGREGKEELRKNFLGALLEAVNGSPLELDFVYGSVKNSVLQPLDGQQRLTTLFLLHWFVAIKEKKLDDELKNLLTKFTYETRTSSREFCIDLINKGIVYNDEQAISDLIIDSSWFFLSWKRDLTIKSMLTMLDAIQQTFQDKTEVWDKLNNISFHYIELQNFGLSDDLYIKMNARGKPLTDFENFKAKFEQHIKQNGWESNLAPTETFAHKIDTVWTDLFWKHKGVEYFVIDYEIINFIAGIAIFNYALKGNEKKVQELSNSPININAEDFVDEESFINLTNALTLYANKANKFDELTFENIPLWSLTNSKTSFKTFIKDTNKGTDNRYSGPSYSQRVFFYALTQFLIDNPRIDKAFFDWIRFSKNLILNTTIDSPTTFVRAIVVLEELLKYKKNILTHLKNGDCDKISFFGTQILEEKIKAQLILNNADIHWGKRIVEAENHPMLRGKINLLLMDKDKSCLDVFKNRVNLLNDLFNENQVKVGKETNLLGRALLAVGLELKYELWLGGCANQYWSEHLKDPGYQPFIIKVFDDLIRLNLPLQEGLESIISENKENYQKETWRRILVENEDLFKEYSDYGKIVDNWRGINLYERQNFNEKTNAILIENNRNQIISDLISQKGFKLKSGKSWLNNTFFSGEEVILIKQDTELVFKRSQVDTGTAPLSYEDEEALNTLITSL